MFALLAAGCGLSDAQEGIVISPASTGPAADLGLGPGVRPLSFGPGDKGYPRVNPSGDRVAFVLDGYVVEKPLHAQGENLYRTAKDFGATGAEWLLDESLAVLSPEGPGPAPTPGSLFASRPDGDESADKLTGGVEAVGAIPGGQAIVAATTDTPESEPPSSRLMLLWGPEEQERISFGGRVEGYVTGLSISPDRSQVVMAVQRNTGQSEVQVYSEGRAERVARLPKGIDILGAPQWTQGGIYFVAGEAARSGENPALYRVSEASEEPEPVREAGEDFVATSIGVSPDGSRLAVMGRRNPGSPTNLYVLDLASDALEAATSNKNMEIKTTPRDLAWSPDGSAVILVARGALSGPEVYDAPAQSLSSAFYNLYEVPVRESGGSS